MPWWREFHWDFFFAPKNKEIDTYSGIILIPPLNSITMYIYIYKTYIHYTCILYIYIISLYQYHILHHPICIFNKPPSFLPGIFPTVSDGWDALNFTSRDFPKCPAPKSSSSSYLLAGKSDENYTNLTLNDRSLEGINKRMAEIYG